jgi:hypothetical protein
MPDDQVVVGPLPAPWLGFLPRPGLLAQLGQPGGQPPVAVLAGPSGTGKTELAATYARARLAAGWRLVAWLNAHDGRSLLTGLAAVADAIGLTRAGPRRPPAEAGRLVRPWLEADGTRCLLVFDGAQDPAVLRPFIPAAGAARILITAAHPPVTELGTAVPVGAFSPAEALAILGGRTAWADSADAAAVAAELAYLPLALDLAATVIAEQRLACPDFLATMQARPAPPGVAGVAQLAADTACAADRLGVCLAVTELMALLPSAGTRRDLLYAAGQAGTLLGGGRRVSPALVDRALARLHHLSLVRFSLGGDVLTMHHLVARAVRDGMNRNGRLPAAFERNVAVYEQVLGADHPETAASRHSLELARQAGTRTDRDQASSGG